jgi:predicted porin
MNKKLLAIAVGAVVALPAAVLANDVTVYGRAHLSVDLLDDGADYSELNMSSNSSRLGFKAEKGEDLKGFMQIEGEITYNNGSSNLSNRDTFAGIKGDFGMVRLGQFDSPFKAARGPANLFGDQVGDMRNLTRVGSGTFDERPANTIHYQTPNFDGLRANLAYSLHAGNTKAADAKDEVVSASVVYKKDALDLAVAFEQWGEDASNGKRSAMRAAIGYGVTDELKLVAFYQTVDHDNDAHDADVLGLGAEYKLTKETAVKGMYMIRSADPDDRDSSMAAIGIEHRLDRSLRVYANYAMVSNDDAIAINPWNQARTTGNTAPAANGETHSAISLGMRFDF